MPPMTSGKLHIAEFLELFRRQRRIARGEIDLRLGKAQNAAEGADRLIIDAGILQDKVLPAGALGLVALRPLRNERKGKG